jgi:eukaryotic-like serine/threonine-protein kinase
VAAVPGPLASALQDRYRLERELGAGGMATVYLAEDVRHHRKVAIKVLHPDLSALLGSERFLKEIELTANLQHPHILPLFDSGATDGLLYYVMPYVEGETLRARLNREKQVPIADAVRIASEVAGALDYAHRRNVIHRDIKPENILLHDGRAVVADFGIALAVVEAGGDRMTQTGMSLGTPQYMSPEQAMGERAISPRSDLYALGCVTYEMLTGEPPFTGPTAQAIVARVLTEQPRRIRAQRNTVPVEVEEAVLVALAKLPADRFRTAANFAAALADPTFRSSSTRSAFSTAGADRPGRGLTVALGGLAAVLAGAAAWGWLRPNPPGPVTRSLVTIERQQSGATDADAPVIAPDGSRIVYSEQSGKLFVLEQDQIDPKLIPGTENSTSPFFSPDGNTVGFGTGFPGALKLAPLNGGVVRTLVADSVSGWGGAWSDDGWVYYMTGEGGTIMRVRPTGSAPEVVARVDSSHDELLFGWPDVLPGGRAVLVTIRRREGAPDIAVVDLHSHEIKVLTQAVRAWYAPSGHLVFVQGDGALMAAPFDAKRLRFTGRPVKMEDGIRFIWGTPQLGLSRNGTLLYERHGWRADVVRVRRDGLAQPVDSSWTGDFMIPAVSPKGDRLALGVNNGGSFELWVKELDHGPFTRLASGGTLNYRPAWSPDGRSVLFPSDRSGIRQQLFSVPADGSAPPHLVFRSTRSIDEGLWSRDGQWLIYRVGSGSARDIYGLRPGVDSPPGLPLAATVAEEYGPALSPDGRWLAYVSEESGQPEVYVRPFPRVGTAREQVSHSGGAEPLWGHTGRELFYRDAAGHLVSAQLASGASLTITSRRVLFDASAYQTEHNHAGYAVAPNDQAFYFVRELQGVQSQEVLVRNWFRELMTRVRP